MAPAGLVLDCDTFFGQYPGERVDWSLPRLRGLLQRHQVGGALTTSLKGVLYSDAEGNQETQEAAAAHTELLPAATLDLRRCADPAGEVERLSDQGFRALRLFPQFQGWSLDSLGLHRTIQALDASGMLLLITAGQPSQLLPALEGVSLPVIALDVHLYGAADAVLACRAYPNLFVSSKLLVGPDTVAFLCDELGSQRVIFGSGAPQLDPGPALSLVRTANIPESCRQEILGGNLQRILQQCGGAYAED